MGTCSGNTYSVLNEEATGEEEEADETHNLDSRFGMFHLCRILMRLSVGQAWMLFASRQKCPAADDVHARYLMYGVPLTLYFERREVEVKVGTCLVGKPTSPRARQLR